ncbi:epoxyqueuosine reductase QueH [Halodesulfovibrio spirochaetisodalis]|uniref:Epoxyqueuosine reductase QueH n=1 Tax=Halodesulfovibrio spirochaetisodalis TaxID=1560234 RepID=A0A1B7XBX7_9BACT|nr:epoxyqueuosine reductase QueH [Halodesulfovibrio spirochaetisodalis]OBQ50186.1 hypothetical protein SP90_10485 [Halodesulfovibrio spirochaetisodalis]
MARVLLHMCCGPCSITTIKELQSEGLEITGFFYNPNIHPTKEYLRRREGALEVANRFDIKVIMRDQEYDPQKWFRTMCYREENRCFHCYAMRMERAFSIGRKGNFDYVTTTLLYSRMQKHEDIKKLGEDMAQGGSAKFLYRDFRTGWKEGIETSKDWGVYRQQYCGCLYSEGDRYAKEFKETCGLKK